MQLKEGDARRVATQQYELDVSRKIAAAVRTSVDRMRPVNQIGTSSAKMDRVASNRRLEGDDGSITVRSSSMKDVVLRAAPEGLIDPMLRTLSFYHDGKPQLQIHYYAAHPQSFYGDGRISYDTVGIAREHLQSDTGVFQLYFTGCGGDVAMGKCNDGSRAARAALTDRIHDAMRRCVADLKLAAVAPILWQTIDVRFPPRRDVAFSAETCRRVLASDNAPFADRLKAAFNLAWIERVAAEDAVELSCLSFGDVRMLHLPGEPFVEYQLAAQRMRPESFVVVAGYGDCGMSYIGGNRNYQDRGGYEPTFAFAGPSEQLLLDAIGPLFDGRGNDG